MITQTDLETCDLTHRHGGVGWIMVEDCGDDYVRVTGYTPKQLGGQAFLAWKKLLSPTMCKGEKVRLPIELGAPIKKLRDSIKSGALVVRQTRIVKP